MQKSTMIMENNEVGRHDWCNPETPFKKPRLTSQDQHSMTEGTGSPEKSILNDDVEFYPPHSSKERKNSQREANVEPKKRSKKKGYRPKVVSQLLKKAKKFQPKSSNGTAELSTPKQKRSYVKKKSQSQRPLFVDEDAISLPFLKIFNSKVEKDGYESSTLRNVGGIEYNSLESYQKLTSLSGACPVENRRTGPNFPIMCNKKRMNTYRIGLLKLLKFQLPFAKEKIFEKGKKRSKSIVRKRKEWKEFSIEGYDITRDILKKLESFKKRRRNQKTNKLVVPKINKSGELVLYKRPSLGVDVILDEETLRVWNLLGSERGHEENDENKRMHWEEIRRTFIYHLIFPFMEQMRYIQGDRRFSPWKGSVLDSVAGAFLTQNVSDHLSSSAFMSLAAKYPFISNISCGQSKEDLTTPNGHELVTCKLAFSEPKFDKEAAAREIEKGETQKDNESSKVDNRILESNCNFMEKCPNSPGMILDNKQSPNSPRMILDNIQSPNSPDKKQLPIKKKNKNSEEKEKLREKQCEYWDTLRKSHTKSRHSDHVDSVDWEAVRTAKASEVANAIASRGQHNIIADRVQGLLNKLMDSYGCVDLEWLRYAPPKESKEYLLSIHGLGLKSVECIRLLTLHHSAFPVDVNVGRIVVRLGWVPLQPLPEEIQIHNLEVFPDPIKIQQYLWPRLCTLDQHALYELHYQMITFGKVFCTKINPNCNACPMKNQCKHFASAVSRTKLALPESTEDQKIVVTPMGTTNANSFLNSSLSHNSGSTYTIEVSESLIGENSKKCEPIIEMPPSPEHDVEMYNCGVYEDSVDIEDFDTVTINLLPMTHNFYEECKDDVNTSKALVTLHEGAANIPRQKMKDVSRLKTERIAYVLTYNHPLLKEWPPLEPDDPSPYLLVLWAADDSVNTSESSETNFPEKDNNSQSFRGTLLIPCRTAMRGCFPLNGTYFQVNEVFADYASMINPINVPGAWLWNLDRRIVYFGTGTSAIMRGLSSEKIQQCFCKGYMCIRAMDAKTRAPRPISSMMHRNTTAKVGKENKKVPVNE